jgi:hypothetical protein
VKAEGRQGAGSVLFVVGIIGAGLLLGLAIVYFVLPRWLVTPQDAPADAAAPTAAGDVRRLVATLYYVSADGASLVGAAREIPFGASPIDQARNIVAAQLEAAPSGQVSAIPTGVTMRGLYITPRGDAYVDLSREIITGHPGGSLNESLTVYALVNALTQNVREITAVQILVDGRQIDTLAGHIDLRQPLAGQPRWVQKGP